MHGQLRVARRAAWLQAAAATPECWVRAAGSAGPHVATLVGSVGLGIRDQGRVGVDGTLRCAGWPAGGGALT